MSDNIYENGVADARLDASAAPSRFRKRYRQLSASEILLHDAIKAKAEEMEALFNAVKSGRYRSLGFTALEESVMWVVKELTG
jgi:hypothetical protein